MALDLDAPCQLYLGTEDGLRTVRLTGAGVEVVDSALPDEAVRAISVHPTDPADAFVGCGLRGRGLYHTPDAGDSVALVGFEERWVWGLARHPDDPTTLYVGTEPPMLYVSEDGGETFDACEGIDDLPSRSEWTFFHAPFRAGHVHGIAIHPEQPERIFAGVEQGALVVSSDGGDTWREALVGRDVHRVAVHPQDQDRVFAGTGSGLYRSPDGGTTWHRIPALEGSYIHAVVFHPRDPARMYVYTAEEDSPVHRSDDGGDTWRPIAAGLPSARPADPLRLHPENPAVVIYAGDVGVGGRLFVSTDAGETWARLDRQLPKVWRVEATPLPR